MKDRTPNNTNTPEAENAAVAKLQHDIELYKTLSERCEKKARIGAVLAIVFCGISLLGTLAIVIVASLARKRILTQMSSTLLYSCGALVFLVLLVGLFLFNASRDSFDLAEDCTEQAKEKEVKLKKLLDRIEEEKKKAAADKIRVVEVLRNQPKTGLRRLSNALRMISAFASAFAIPVASFAVLGKSKKEKK